MEHTIVLLGISGSGKTTQAALLEARGWKVLVTGDIVQELAHDDPGVARRYQRGELVPDAMLFPAIQERLSGLGQGRVVCDGFPRSASQASWLARTSRSPELAILIRVSMEEAKRRLEQRGRADDTPETFLRKRHIFAREVLPVADYYRGLGLLSEIDGEGSPEDVAGRIAELLGETGG